MNKIILFDIDYTLFDTDKFRDSTYPQLRKLLEQEDIPSYHQKVKEIEKKLITEGGYEPVSFARVLTEALEIPLNHEEIRKLFYDKNLYDACLYPEVKDVLKKLSEKNDIVLGIVSRGEDSFQRRKIQAIANYFPNENIFISLVKTDLIHKILERFPKNLYIIDDSAPFLYEVKKTDVSVFACLVEKENRYERKPVAEGFVADTVITDLGEILDIIDRK